MSASVQGLLQRVEEAFDTPGLQAAALRRVGHRPWPLPEGPWMMGQTWQRLLFAHWRVPAESVAPLVSAPLELETYDGDAWVSITPFVVTGLRLRGTPPLPVLSRFYEANVRTYVTYGDRPGIWFFTLDASRLDVVLAARATYRLPYRHATVTVKAKGDVVEWASRRRQDGAVLRASYRPSGALLAPEPGSLDAWLTERYRLYAIDDGRLFHADIHHAPWPLQPAACEVQQATIAPRELHGVLAGEPLCRYADRQDVLIWPLAQTAPATAQV